MTYDLAVFLSRFAPPDHARLAMMKAALSCSQRVVALVGSAEATPTPKDPWGFDDRAAMLAAALGDDAARVTMLPLRDHLYNEDRWRAEAQAQVARVAGDAASIALVCTPQDAVLFPQWRRLDIDAPTAPPARAYRDALFDATGGGLSFLRAHTPAPVVDMIAAFRETARFAELREEYRCIEQVRADWSHAPYPPIFVTVDSVVAHSGHVLLIERRDRPGRGLWALPGGFLEPPEWLRDGAIRELREETMIDMPTPVLLGGLRASRAFDHPQRSLRERTITHGFHFDFPTGALPKVQGGDDAARAQWIEMGALPALRARMFEDHFFILEYFLGIY
jgi:bifunctional NMN adenylyltransferase/nudix hydrolase